MDATRLKQIEEIYHAALEIPPDERESFFKISCGEDESLRREVKSLLSFENTSDSLIDTPLKSLAAEMLYGRTKNLKGKTLGHYKILSLLGKGGMGAVYLAEDSKLDRKIAVKLLSKEFGRDTDKLNRFIREAKAASALNHPNILTVYEIGEVGGINYIATEFIDGKVLSQHNSKEKITLESVLDISIQIVSALQTAHEAGIVHRDIKPDNVMIRKDGIVKVLDFGLAKLTEKRSDDNSDLESAARAKDTTIPGLIMGTPNYMSPEQARGKDVDHQTDIFSFGVMLYEMLSGKLPFEGETVGDIIAFVLTKEPKRLREMNRELPPELEEIVHKSLQKDKQKRYRTARDLLRDLKDVKQDLEHQSRLERISSPNWEEQQTQFLKANQIAGEAPAQGETQNRNSIAVLPFTNLSNDVENEYFCDGLAEELLNALAKIEQLKVAARTSAFSFKGKQTNVAEIGKALGVGNVLEGSVRKSGNKVRISVQLINAADGYQIWAERYDREMQDIFDVQDEIALAIVDVLKVKLFGLEKSAVLKRHTANTEAYELYLKGLYFYNKHTEEGWRKAIEYFEQTIAKAPEYAPAYAGIGSCCATLWYYCFLPSEQIVSKWKANASRALEIDDNLPEAHFTMGGFQFVHEWNWAEAEREYRRSIELKPNSPDAFWRLGLLLTVRERFDEAIVQARKAIELDPLSLSVNLYAGHIYRNANRLEEAFAQCQKLIEFEPRFYGAYWLLGKLYKIQGKYEDAIEAFQKSIALGGTQTVLSILGDTYALAGKTDEALTILNQLLEMRENQYVAAFNIARIYCGLGDKEKSFEWLEKAFEERNGEMVFLKVQTHEGEEYSFRKVIRQDARFTNLLRRVGLPTGGKEQGESVNKTNAPRFEKKLSPASTGNLDGAKTLIFEAADDETTIPPNNFSGERLPLIGREAFDSAKETHITDEAVSGTKNYSTNDSLKAQTAILPPIHTTIPDASPPPNFLSHIRRKSVFLTALIILLATGGFFGYRYLTANASIKSIAVLPFVNVGDDRDSEYLADGLSENLINTLSRLPQLKVIARSSSFKFRGENIDVQDAAKKLGVAAILTGRVVRRVDDLQISVELIDTADNTRIWGDIYNRKVSGALSVPEEIAQAVSEKLQLKLSGAQERQMAKQITQSPQAYQFYMNGVFFRRKNGAENIRKAIEYQKQAIALDPNFARAYTELSINFTILVEIAALSPNEGMPPARAAAEKALALDETLAEAHYTIARVRDFEFDWTGAESAFKRAIELNPNLAGAHTLYAEYLSRSGRFDEALREVKLAQELDPLRTGLVGNEGLIFYHARRYDEAIAKKQIHASSAAENPFAHLELANAYVQKGQYAEAILSYQTSIKLEETTSALIYLGRVYALSGKRSEAIAILDKLKTTEKYVSPTELAILYAALGDKEKAFASLEKAFTERDFQLTSLKVEPGYDPLRDDSRFQDLLKRIGLTE